MRKINKPDVIPDSLKSKECNDKLKEIIEDRKKGKKEVEIVGGFYRGDDCDPQSTVYKLYQIYNYKCAYCEEERRKLDVEHYRPKNKITDEPKHLGYYWLCYEWSNLLIACKDCNRDWKKEHFPINGTRVFDTKVKWPLMKKELSNLKDLNNTEDPILLHPEEKEFLPHEFFSFNILGRMKGLDVNDKGIGTIKICNLNRADLRKRRKKVIDQVVKQVSIATQALNPDLSNRKKVIELIKMALHEINLDDDTIEYTLLHKILTLRFEELILSQFHIKLHDIILTAFDEHFNLN